ncbi:MAG TPA: hypothetical protein DHV28_00930 [Ignavibacteriales bacterium]|nr:hypothetical protein [Ignavibacteriales bacterium]
MYLYLLKKFFIDIKNTARKKLKVIVKLICQCSVLLKPITTIANTEPIIMQIYYYNYDFWYPYIFI